MSAFLIGSLFDDGIRGELAQHEFVFMGFGMLLAGLLMVEVSRRWLNLMLGTRQCFWSERR